MSSAICEMLEKCDIYYDGALISKESILDRYFSFFANSMDPNERKVGFAFHTGSVCFDVMAVVAVGIGCLSYNLATNDDILDQLHIDEMVMYKNQRYRWKGTERLNGSDSLYIKLEKDAVGKNGPSLSWLPYDKNKHLISPYYGGSKKTDGRGVKRSKNKRENFLATVFGISVSEVPTQMDISVVVVSERDIFTDICKKVRIEYNGGEQINLLDIVPASYFTNGGIEYQFGSNPTKAEPVIKVAGNISTARDLVLDNRGNKVIGLLVFGNENLIGASSELSDLIRRNSLKFVLLESPLQSSFGSNMLKLYDDASVFACTKEYLAKEKNTVNIHNKYTKELRQQISALVNSTVIPQKIEGGMNHETYLKIKYALLRIKESDLREDLRDEFIITAQSILNLLNTAVFSMEKIEYYIKNENIRHMIISPKKRIEYLWELSDKAEVLQDLCTMISDSLEQQYINMLTSTPKEIFLQNFIENHRSDRIAVIVPKAYYADLLRLNIIKRWVHSNVTYITPSRFNSKNNYDIVIIVGGIKHRKFDLMSCFSSTQVCVLLYECEEADFTYHRKKIQTFTNSLNTKIGLLNNRNVLLDSIETQRSEQEIQKFATLDEYIDNLSTFDVYKFATNSRQSDGAAPVSEVTHVGEFTSGERILISKYYSAVVFDADKGTVIEKEPTELVQGDVMVFTKRDDYTKNIVDEIYERLLISDRLGKQSYEIYEKSQHWKKCLRKYKEKNKFTYRDVAQKLRECGSTLQEVTVRQWLIEDSHIVGPRDVDTMKYIAEITQDPYLLKDVIGYFNACRNVRHERRNILRLIAQAINDRLAGFVPQKGSVLEVVYDNIEKLSETKELEDILQLSESVDVNIYFVNKPITEAEV